MHEKLNRLGKHIEEGRFTAVGLVTGTVLTATAFMGMAEGMVNASGQTIKAFTAAAIVEAGITSSFLSFEIRKQNYERLIELQKDTSVKIEEAMRYLGYSSQEENQATIPQAGEKAFRSKQELNR